MLATGLLVVHNTGRGGEDDVAELTRGQKLDSPFLELTELNGVAGVDNTALVETICDKVRIHIFLKSFPMKGRYTNRPLSWMTILPERWSSTSSNSPM